MVVTTINIAVNAFNIMPIIVVVKMFAGKVVETKVSFSHKVILIAVNIVTKLDSFLQVISDFTISHSFPSAAVSRIGFLSLLEHHTFSLVCLIKALDIVPNFTEILSVNLYKC